MPDSVRVCSSSASMSAEVTSMLVTGLGRDDNSPHRSRRFCNGVEDSLWKELGVREEERCVPTKQHEAGNATAAG